MSLIEQSGQHERVQRLEKKQTIEAFAAAGVVKVSQYCLQIAEQAKSATDIRQQVAFGKTLQTLDIVATAIVSLALAPTDISIIQWTNNALDEFTHGTITISPRNNPRNKKMSQQKATTELLKELAQSAELITKIFLPSVPLQEKPYVFPKLSETSARQALFNARVLRHDTHHMRTALMDALLRRKDAVTIDQTLDALMKWEYQFPTLLKNPYLPLTEGLYCAIAVITKKLDTYGIVCSTPGGASAAYQTVYSPTFLEAIVNNAVWNWNNYAHGEGTVAMDIITTDTVPYLALQFINKEDDWPADIKQQPETTFLEKRIDRRIATSNGTGLSNLAYLARDRAFGTLLHTSSTAGQAILELRIPLQGTGISNA